MPKDLKYKQFHFNVGKCEKAIDEDGQETGVFSGSFATEDLDRGGDIIAPNAMSASLQRYRDENRRIKLYYQHNTGMIPIGGVDPSNIVKNGKNWDITLGELDLDIQHGKEVYSALKKKNLTDMSIGYTIKDLEYRDIDGQDVAILKEIELWEISIVGEPMNPNATVNEVKSFPQIESMKDIETVLKDNGLSSNQRKILISKIKEFSTVKDQVSDNCDDCVNDPDGEIKTDVRDVHSKLDDLNVGHKLTQIINLINK